MIGAQPFSAFQPLIDEEIKHGKLSVRNENWYAPEIGLIKQIQSAFGETTKMVELKSITTPKK